jgi:hypothetical protein
MTSIEANARPALATPPAVAGQPSQLAGKREDGDPQAQAWRREMERAQMETWLSHGPLGRCTSASAAQLSSAVPGGAASPAVASSKAMTGGFAASATPTPAVLASPEIYGAAGLHAASGVASPRAASVADSESHPHPSSVLTAAKPSVIGMARPPSGFNAASLTQALQRFGAVEATTASRSLAPRSLPAPPAAAEKVNRALPAAGVLAPAPGQVVQLPAAFPSVSELPVEVALQAHAPSRQSPAALEGGAKLPPPLVPDAPVESIRVHAEWSEDGVRLWVGVDADVLSSLDQITQQLQAWVAGRGLRLRALSCNGQALSREFPAQEYADFTHASGEPAGSPSVRSTSKEFP